MKDTAIAAAAGSIGGVTNFFLNVQSYNTLFPHLVEIGIAALVSGFLGILGKECYFALKKFITRKSKTKP